MTLSTRTLSLVSTSFFSALLLAGCAGVPSELRNEKEITVVYRQGALPTITNLQSGGAALGVAGAMMDQATTEKNRANQSRLDAMNAIKDGQSLLTSFKASFKEALKDKGLQSVELPSTGGPRQDVRTHVPSFDRESIKTRWVIQIDEVQTSYNASNAFASYKPWVWVKFALFDMQDKSLTPIVPLTPANFGSTDKYHYRNSEALAAARPEDLLSGLQLTVKAAALDTAQRIRP